jgi:signal transduction histidine kinase
VIANSNIFKSSTFRLVAIYLLVFAISAGAMLAYVFWSTVGLMESQTQDTIRVEVERLADEYAERSLPGLAEAINHRISDQNGTLYLLTDPAGNRITGNLVAMPQPSPRNGEWVDFPFAIGKGELQANHTAHALAFDLASDYKLLVGRDVGELREFRSLIENTLLWAIVPVLLLGLGGGLLTSRNFLRRVDAITETSRAIMAGDLTSRMPVTGSGDELDRLSQSLNDMLGQIEKLMQGMKEVTINVAHDLRTPLTRLRARAESALRIDDATEQKQALQQTLNESDKLLQTFNALLSIARVDAGQVREGLASVNLSEIVQDMTELYEPMVEESGGTFLYSVEENVKVRADRQLLSQVFSNLLDNSMKYGADSKDEKARISVNVHTEEGNAVVTIADKGAGIPPNQREHVLQRFVRLDESRTKPGNGLGLSLVSSVIKLHGGTLTLDDANPGLKAIITLPLLA